MENYWLKNTNGVRVPVFEIYLSLAVPEKSWRRKFSLKMSKEVEILMTLHFRPFVVALFSTN